MSFYIKGVMGAGDPLLQLVDAYSDHIDETGVQHIPAQTGGDTGKFLQTNGSAASWQSGSAAAAHASTHEPGEADELDVEKILDLATYDGNDKLLIASAGAGAWDGWDWMDLSDLSLAHAHPYSATGHTHAGADVTGFTVSRALSSNASGYIAVAATTLPELNRLTGISDNVQDQLDAKSAAGHTHSYSVLGHSHDHMDIGGLTASRVLVSNGTGFLYVSAITSAELNMLNNIGTTEIATQLAGKAASSHNQSAATITSGVLPITYGGTGTATIGTSGNLVYYDGSAPATLSTRSAGSTISDASTASSNPTDWADCVHKDDFDALVGKFNSMIDRLQAFNIIS